MPLSSNSESFHGSCFQPYAIIKVLWQMVYIGENWAEGGIFSIMQTIVYTDSQIICHINPEPQGNKLFLKLLSQIILLE